MASIQFYLSSYIDGCSVLVVLHIFLVKSVRCIMYMIALMISTWQRSIDCIGKDYCKTARILRNLELGVSEGGAGTTLEGRIAVAKEMEGLHLRERIVLYNEPIEL